MLERIHEYLRDKLEYPAEAKDTDYKAAVKFAEKTDFAAKLVKHILGFANSGIGYIIIGYKEQPDRSLAPDPDITDEIAASYEVTRLCQHVEKYLVGQDRIEIKIYKEEFGGVRYPIISIARFHEYPFVCTKDYVSPTTGETIIESGQINIRTEGARTLIVKSPSEWRQLIKECIKARQEIEAKRPTEGGEEEGARAEEVPLEAKRPTEGGEEEGARAEEVPLEVKKPVSIEKGPKALAKAEEAEKQFAAWVKNENDNAINEIKSAGFTEGFFKFVIQVPNGLDPIDSATLLEIARKSECHKTGWPIGVVMMKPEYKPAPLADGIRAIMNTGDGFDYWALNIRGHFFFIRSHQEDASHVQKSAEESKFLWFDTTIWRISEIFCYVSNMCTELNLKQSDKIKLTILYEGIKDRVLSISNRRGAPFSRVRRCSVDKYEKDLELQVVDIMPKLKDYVYEVVKGLFGFFDFYKSDRALVDSFVDEFLNSRL